MASVSYESFRCLRALFPILQYVHDAFLYCEADLANSEREFAERRAVNGCDVIFQEEIAG